MQRNVHLWAYGHYGPPLLVFPSAAGMAHEWEAQGMVEALSEFLEAGKLKLYCTESNVSEAWTRKENPPDWRIQRHQMFESYIVNELVPWIREDCQTEDIKIGVSGTSLGALFSAIFALKHPETFHWALCMSGRYDALRFMDGKNSPDVYFNNPLAFVPNLDGEPLERIRRNTHLVLVCGRGRWEEGNIEETNALADMLQAKGIGHERDIWGPEVSHQWPWWQKQARHHIGRALAR